MKSKMIVLSKSMWKMKENFGFDAFEMHGTHARIKRLWQRR